MAATDSGLQRGDLLRRLATRNRVVGILRIGVPVLGLLVLLSLVLQLVLAGLGDNFHISGISIDRNNLVLQTPTYAGTSTDGTQYVLSAGEARAALGDTNLILLKNLTARYGEAGAGQYRATAPAGELDSRSQHLVVSGATTLSTDSGITGTLDAVAADFPDRHVESGRVDVRLSDGTLLKAATMAYDSRARIFTFTRVDLTLPDTPGAETTP